MLRAFAPAVRPQQIVQRFEGAFVRAGNGFETPGAIGEILQIGKGLAQIGGGAQSRSGMQPGVIAPSRAALGGGGLPRASQAEQRLAGPRRAAGEFVQRPLAISPGVEAQRRLPGGHGGGIQPFASGGQAAQRRCVFQKNRFVGGLADMAPRLGALRGGQRDQPLRALAARARRQQQRIRRGGRLLDETYHNQGHNKGLTWTGVHNPKTFAATAWRHGGKCASANPPCRGGPGVANSWGLLAPNAPIRNKNPRRLGGAQPRVRRMPAAPALPRSR
ncbi:MAG: hypothetical protein BWZ10_02346 [candidate division BRC1 bacterium ADurb.BinA364]|nr:MAG: hypothetical protein BWZ10_02346 [candidate division BRC1 bacterium ADurb.BinA364]